MGETVPFSPSESGRGTPLTRGTSPCLPPTQCTRPVRGTPIRPLRSRGISVTVSDRSNLQSVPSSSKDPRCTFVFSKDYTRDSDTEVPGYGPNYPSPVLDCGRVLPGAIEVPFKVRCTVRSPRARTRPVPGVLNGRGSIPDGWSPVGMTPVFESDPVLSPTSDHSPGVPVD